ncbi:MAG: DUF3341 domain-containing protein [Vicinamibacterales bacterium]|jgi:hypothetical protein
MHVSNEKTGLYGLMAEFDSAQGILDASARAVGAGYTKLEAYTPFPIEELNDIIHKRRTRLPKLVLLMAFVGMGTGFVLQYWASTTAYPFNIGGRPLATWPAFVVPSYELTILFSALTAAIGMVAFNGLPQPYHPVFNVERFTLASTDKFFLVIEADDAHFGKDETTAFLQDAGAKGVYDVAH